MTTKENKIKQSETRTIWRSEIKLAEYNPRKISDEAKKLLKANLKRLGIMGGVVWNEQTGNLVAGHQKVSICDEINRYGEGKNDYQLKVEVVSLTEIEEKEQNLFMNNRAAQGEFDEDMLRSLISDIDLSLAGFNDFDVSLLSTDVDFEFKDNGVIWQNDNEDVKDIGKDKGEGVKRDVNFYEDSEENKAARHNEIKKIKDRINNTNDEFNDKGMLSYVVLSFHNPKNKQSFMTRFGMNKYDKYIPGEDFSQIIERID